MKQIKQLMLFGLLIGMLLFNLRTEAAINLDYVRATALPDGTIEVEWRTATEDETAGFSLKRTSSPPDSEFLTNASGPFIDFVERGTDETVRFLLARGSTVAGDTYTVIDKNVMAGETYYYMLVETQFSGTRRVYSNDIATESIPYHLFLPIVRQ